MRHKSLVLLLTFTVVALRGEPVPALPQDAPPEGSASAGQPATPGGLDQADLQDMLGPIALYPDELLANVLTASIYPDELKAASAFVTGGGDAAKIPDQGWESSVNAIARIPDVLAFLVESIDWTTAVGQAYIVQSTDVMAAVQALRAKAQTNGALKTSPEQTVIQDGSTIIIEPADPEVIYVPSYQPQVVYASSPPVYVENDDDELLAGVIGFGVGLAVGACFDDDFDCDWHGGCVGWGHNEVDIDRNVNIETGDININSGNTVQGGDRTNVKGGNKTNNNVGREGTKYQPNSNKVDTNKIKSGGASQLQGYKGVSQNKGAQGNRVPQKTTANSGRTSPAAVQRNNARPAGGNSAGNARPSAGNSANNARPSAGDSGRSPSASPSRSPSAKPATPKKPAPKAPSPAARSTPSKSKPSGFSPERGSGKSSSRGASSRGGGGSRSGGGGGRGGGGRGR